MGLKGPGTVSTPKCSYIDQMQLEFSLSFWPQEYVASITGLYKNNGAVSCVGKYFPFIQQLYRIYLAISQGVTFNLIPNHIESCYGQISIETATYSFCNIMTLVKLIVEWN